MSVGAGERPSSVLRVGRPAQHARNLLSACLGGLQDVGDPQVNVQHLTGIVAKAVGELFHIQNMEIADPAHLAGVRKAMDHLRTAMQILQDTDTKEAAVHRTTETIAKVMAVLYPLAKAYERASLPPPPPAAPRQVPHDPRRSARRLPLDVDIGFQSDTNFYVGFSEDVSEGGLFVSTYDFLPIGARLSLNFSLPDGSVVSAGGVVRWVREYNPQTPDVSPGMGVQFVDLDGEDRAAIQRFLRLRAPMFYEHG
jgi:uncharacterized protein (TIGR02266 family)